MEPKVRTQLFEASRPIYTKVRDDMPARYGLGSQVTNSIIADGCLIEGEWRTACSLEACRCTRRQAAQLRDHAGRCHWRKQPAGLCSGR